MGRFHLWGQRSNERVYVYLASVYVYLASERSPTLIGQNGNSRYLYVTYVTQNAHALTHAHEIATKQRHNKQSFSLSLKLKHYCSEYYGTQRTRKQAKEGPRTPSRN